MAVSPDARLNADPDVRLTRIYGFLRVIVRTINRLLFRVTVDGPGSVPAEGPVIVAPVHRSFIDFWVASEVTRRKLHYMAKDSLWGNRLLARLIPTLGGFPVNRDAPDRESLRRAQRVLEAGEVLMMFPEGTRRDGPVVTDLHEGVAFLAARTGATIVPVGIGGSASVMPKGSHLPKPHHIHLVVGQPIEVPAPTGPGRVPRSRTHEITEQLAASIQQLYERALAAAGRP
ncbi:MAG TPA: lysophospholipid acyltransferase family protein [Acidimicrobiales bacterium]|nr:lysophospholipid acyltransferase family protein [Acidimicrobiales bacterium]